VRPLLPVMRGGLVHTACTGRDRQAAYDKCALIGRAEPRDFTRQSARWLLHPPCPPPGWAGVVSAPYGASIRLRAEAAEDAQRLQPEHADHPFILPVQPAAVGMIDLLRNPTVTFHYSLD
jgi:hypothetical protein